MKFNLKFYARARILRNGSQRILYAANGGRDFKILSIRNGEVCKSSDLRIFKFRLFAP